MQDADWINASVNCYEAEHRRYIYFFKVHETLKIGITISPRTRVSQLSNASPYGGQLLGVIPGTLELEQQIHDKWNSLRGRGEWFSFTDELRSWVSMLITGVSAALNHDIGHTATCDVCGKNRNIPLNNDLPRDWELWCMSSNDYAFSFPVCNDCCPNGFSVYVPSPKQRLGR